MHKVHSWKPNGVVCTQNFSEAENSWKRVNGCGSPEVTVAWDFSVEKSNYWTNSLLDESNKTKVQKIWGRWLKCRKRIWAKTLPPWSEDWIELPLWKQWASRFLERNVDEKTLDKVWHRQHFLFLEQQKGGTTFCTSCGWSILVKWPPELTRNKVRNQTSPHYQQNFWIKHFWPKKRWRRMNLVSTNSCFNCSTIA